jgi:uncharacterized membrane protein
MMGQLAVGLFLSALIGGLGYWRRALTVSGVVGAILVGTVIFGLGGWVWGLLLVTFFVSSSWLSHYRRAAVVTWGRRSPTGVWERSWLWPMPERPIPCSSSRLLG